MWPEPLDKGDPELGLKSEAEVSSGVKPVN
jgi:hypothetical protein